jgi:hypothetical protein
MDRCPVWVQFLIKLGELPKQELMKIKDPAHRTHIEVTSNRKVYLNVQKNENLKTVSCLLTEESRWLVILDGYNLVVMDDTDFNLIYEVCTEIPANFVMKFTTGMVDAIGSLLLSKRNDAFDSMILRPYPDENEYEYNLLSTTLPIPEYVKLLAYIYMEEDIIDTYGTDEEYEEDDDDEEELSDKAIVNILKGAAATAGVKESVSPEDIQQLRNQFEELRDKDVPVDVATSYISLMTLSACLVQFKYEESEKKAKIVRDLANVSMRVNYEPVKGTPDGTKGNPVRLVVDVKTKVDLYKFPALDKTRNWEFTVLDTKNQGLIYRAKLANVAISNQLGFVNLPPWLSRYIRHSSFSEKGYIRWLDGRPYFNTTDQTTRAIEDDDFIIYEKTYNKLTHMYTDIYKHHFLEQIEVQEYIPN